MYGHAGRAEIRVFESPKKWRVLGSEAMLIFRCGECRPKRTVHNAILAARVESKIMATTSNRNGEHQRITPSIDAEFLDQFDDRGHVSLLDPSLSDPQPLPPDLLNFEWKGQSVERNILNANLGPARRPRYEFTANPDFVFGASDPRDEPQGGHQSDTPP